MTIEFAALLTLEVTHAYYGGGRCLDFGFAIPSATERLLAGGRLLAKPREGRLNVLFEKGPGGGPLVSLAGRTLQFGLKLANPFFSNFTELPLLPGEGLALYRNNGPDPGRLEGPVALLLNAADDQDAELLREGLFGLVEIELGAAFYTAAPGFEVQFDAREETLKYYVVARNYASGEFNELAVSDAGFTGDSRPRIDFTRVSASAFAAEDLPAAMLGGPDARVTLFRSDQPVARREKARRRIQLARNNDVIIPQLPQPGAAAATGNLVIHLSK